MLIQYRLVLFNDVVERLPVHRRIVFDCDELVFVDRVLLLVAIDFGLRFVLGKPFLEPVQEVHGIV